MGWSSFGPTFEWYNSTWNRRHGGRSFRSAHQCWSIVAGRRRWWMLFLSSCSPFFLLSISYVTTAHGIVAPIFTIGLPFVVKIFLETPSIDTHRMRFHGNLNLKCISMVTWRLTITHGKKLQEGSNNQRFDKNYFVKLNWGTL